MTITDDIEEFMGIPYRDVVMQVAVSKDEDVYLKQAIADMFPWGVKEGDMWDFYRSDKYSAYLFWKVVHDMEKNEKQIPQAFANIAEGHYTQPRILIYGCGTGLVAISLRIMHLHAETIDNKTFINDQAVYKNITIADIPGKYFEFLKFMSEKYGLGFKFIPLEKGKDCLNKRYDLILFNSAFGQDPLTVLHYMVEHLEELQYIYLNAVTLYKSSYRYPDIVKVEGMGMEPVRTDDSAWRLWKKKMITIPQQDEVKVPANVKGDRIFPASIACLSTLPGTSCGIATNTQWLADSLSKHYPTGMFRDINQNVPKDALILSAIEFGIFEDTRMLINPAYENNWKFAIWHAVLRDPFKGYIKYVQDIDAEYDVHIVHTVAQKMWLSKYVSKPVFIIPLGALVWDPVPAGEAKEKLGLPGNMKIAFVFGFAADNKGLDELIEVSRKVNVTIPDFRIVMSAGVNCSSEDATEYTGKLQNNLKKAAQSTGTIVLGKYLTEDEINLWASAADILVFNYKTPPYVASASGAMKRVLAAGKPIICVNDNRLEELVDGQHCLKFQAGDIDEFARCITALLSDKETADKLGTNCRTLAEQTSWDRAAEKVVKLIEETVTDTGQEYYGAKYFAGGRKEKKSIGIGISTYNDYASTANLIDSIKRFTPGEYKLVVVDDGTPNNEIFNTLYTLCSSNSIELRRNTRNRGIPYTWNRIVEALNTDIVIIFNNDIVVTNPDWLKHIEYFLNNNEMIGGVGFPLIQIGQVYTESAWGVRPGHVGAAVGCSFGFKKEVWQKVRNPDGTTGFWEDLISFHEETHFGFMLSSLGYYNYQLPFPPMAHYGGQTFHKNRELTERPVDWTKWNKQEYIEAVKKSNVYPEEWKKDRIAWTNEKGKDVVDRMAFSRYMFAKHWNVLGNYNAPQVPVHERVVTPMPKRRVKWLDRELREQEAEV